MIARRPRGAELVSRNVEKIEYRHVEEEADDAVRFHVFGNAVELWALPDGSLLLRHAKGKKLWEDF